MDAIDRRIAALEEWLTDMAPFCFADQRHLDENTPERAYWHYGYLMALKDIRNRTNSLTS